MFVSHFTKWMWIKIYYNFYYSVYFKHIISKERRKTIVYCWFLGPIGLVLLFLVSKELFNLPKFFAYFLIISPLIIPLSFMLIYCPKEVICFKTLPSNLEQEQIFNSLKTSNQRDNGNFSLDFNRNSIDNHNYDALFDTKDFFLLYKDSKKGPIPEHSIILIINKKENQGELDKDNQNFLEFALPKCKKYIKKA
jgi:hypothetical protein